MSDLHASAPLLSSTDDINEPEFLIPFNRSFLLGRELEYIQDTVTKGQLAGNQTYSRKCEQLLTTVLSTERSLLTTSCTHALEMAAMLLNIQPGDEVIVPSFTFVSTANAFVLRGARPIFCDVRSDTLNLDETVLEKLITPRTKAIVVVHYAGVSCEMNAINHVATKHQLVVVEDNAHGLFGKYRGKWLGTLGSLATQSFHETKNISCGEGGALLINDTRYISRAEVIREKGTDRAAFFRGQIAKYSWQDIGSSYVMSDVLAAYLYAQLEVWTTVQAKRKRLWQRYDRGLTDWATLHGVIRPFVPAHCDQAWHMYYLLLPSLQARSALAEHLKSKGVLAVFHYLPLHLSNYAERWGGRVGDCPIAEQSSDRLLRLPFFTTMSEAMQLRVISTIREFNLPS